MNYNEVTREKKEIIICALYLTFEKSTTILLKSRYCYPPPPHPHSPLALQSTQCCNAGEIARWLLSRWPLNRGQTVLVFIIL